MAVLILITQIVDSVYEVLDLQENDFSDALQTFRFHPTHTTNTISHIINVKPTVGQCTTGMSLMFFCFVFSPILL